MSAVVSSTALRPDASPTDMIATSGLGRRYGRIWALRDCTLSVPAGAIVALVGPNGAGKTTLLHLMAGLLRSSAGTVEVAGADPARSRSVIPRIGLVAQDMPLYKGFTVADTLALGRHVNPTWDPSVAERLDRLGIPLDQKVGTLSGGQRAQVALALALGKRPDVLLLDEPLAALDPLARRDLLATLMEIAADGGLTIVLSSHLIADLERVCDHLVLVAGSRVHLAGAIDDLLEEHAVLVGGPLPDAGSSPLPGIAEVVRRPEAGSGPTLVRLDGPFLDTRWEVESVALEELVLGYLEAAYARHAASQADPPDPPAPPVSPSSTPSGRPGPTDGPDAPTGDGPPSLRVLRSAGASGPSDSSRAGGSQVSS